ncbi:MAG: class I tRNA ligase family protein, partial [Lachnospiraceae bacterium]|nr:class I tRNA ligase family protein [Lachnospiraceae bacterium]
IDGVFRFLGRFWRLVHENLTREVPETPELVKTRHQLIHTISTRLEQFNLNTVVSGFMEFNNKLLDMSAKDGVDRETLKTFVQLVAPFAPHVGEELWSKLGGAGSVFSAPWPVADEKLMQEDTVEIAVQVNGKVRVTINIAKDAGKDEAISAAKEALGDKLTGNIVKEIYVPGKIVNIVAK